MRRTPDPESGEVVFSRMRWNTPLSDDHAVLLLDRLKVERGDAVIDLGCGWGQLLLAAVASVSEATGVGVDLDPTGLARARAAVTDAGLSDRITFRAEDAAAWVTLADRIICVGASHAWGGTVQALQALLDLVRPGGSLLFGDGCWEHPPPSAEASAIFGDEVLALNDLVDQASAMGWRITHLSTADQREWDVFEGSWRAGRHEWLSANPDDERADQIRQKLAAQLEEYVGVYRGVLGFTYLVLTR